MTTGMDLKIERVRSRVRAIHIAEKMGVSRQRVAQIEALAVVEADTARRYRDALVSVARERQDALGAA